MTPRTALALLIVFLTLTARSSSAQEPTPFPTFPPVPTVAIPENPIITPISGEVIAYRGNELGIFNPASENFVSLPQEIGAAPQRDFQGQFIASTTRNSPLGLPNGIAQITDMTNQSSVTAFDDLSGRSSAISTSWTPVGWSYQNQIMYRFSAGDRNLYPGNTIGAASRGFDIFDVTTNEMTRVLEIPPMTLLNDIFPSPLATEGMVLDFINESHWNPIYTEWIFVQPIGYGRDESGQETGRYDAGLYNWATRQYISLATLFPQTVISSTGWSADGSMMAFTTMTGLSIIHFSLDENGASRLRLLADGIDTRDQAVLNWLGVDNLLITGISAPYQTTFIAQIIGDEWYSQEFFALTGPVRTYFLPGSWRLTADEAEQKALRCLFVDRASAPIMTVGGRGQVAFTGGTPSRLRYLPGTDSSVAASLPEGTAFTVTGGPECAQGYRWWQVTLSDGMVGWVAEGAPDEYWIEPLP